MDNKYISKGIELHIGVQTIDATTGTAAEKDAASRYAELLVDAASEGVIGTKNAKLGSLIPDVQEIGDLAAGASSERDKIEVTTLADDKHVYADGLLVDAEFDSIDFKLLYNPNVYALFKELIEVEKALSGRGFANEYNVVIPNLGEDTLAVFTIKGSTAIKVDGVGVNGAVTMTLTITPKEEIAFNSAVTRA